MNKYYQNKDYTIYKYSTNEMGGFLFVPNEVNSYMDYIDKINKLDIIQFRKKNKKDILFFCEKINKFVEQVNKTGLVNLPLVDYTSLNNAYNSGNYKDFDEKLVNVLQSIKNINVILSKCQNRDQSTAMTFNTLMTDNASDKDFIKWMSANPYNLYSSDTFLQAKSIYEEQKNMVASNTDGNENVVNLSNVASVPNSIVDIPKVNTDVPLNYESKSNTTLDEVGLDPTGEISEKNQTTFALDPMATKDNTNMVISPNTYDEGGNSYGQEKSKTKTLSKPGGKFGYYPTHNENSDWKKAAYTNWYGIILTLIFSFAIGYLIAWVLIKVR